MICLDGRKRYFHVITLPSYFDFTRGFGFILGFTLHNGSLASSSDFQVLHMDIYMISIYIFYIRTRCVQMPPIMTNSKYGEGHKDRYLDTSKHIFSQEMLICYQNKK